MKARAVHAVLAAGVRSPDLIVRWQKKPESLRRHGVEPEALDLPALRKFTGLTLKVRHNGIRHLLPMTFRLMSHAGFEIELFATYAVFCAENDRKLATAAEERIRDLVAFVETWIDLRRSHHALLWDLIRHEQALALLAKPTDPARPAEDPGCRVEPSVTAIPRICGRIILHRMRSDPRIVAATLTQRDPRLPRARRTLRYHCYWRSEAGNIQLVELDALGYYALTFVNGTRTVADVSRELVGASSPVDKFLRLLSQLVQAGMLEFLPADPRAVP